MKTLEIQVPDEVASRLEHAARANGMSIDALVRLSVEEKLTRDAELESAAKYVLTKNSKLYERLS